MLTMGRNQYEPFMVIFWSLDSCSELTFARCKPFNGANYQIEQALFLKIQLKMYQDLIIHI